MIGGHNSLVYRLQTGFVAIALAGVVATAAGCRTKSSNAKEDQSNASGDSRCSEVTTNTFNLPPAVDDAPTCKQLTGQFNTLDTKKSDEDNVICPFLRILYRADILRSEISDNLKLGFIQQKDMDKPVKVDTLADAAKTFGCGAACKGVASQVSTGQGFDKLGDSSNTPYVDIGKLYNANGTAHDCGFNFSLGQHAASDSVRDATLQLMKDHATDGRLTLQNLYDVKQAACDRDYDLHMKDSSLKVINEIKGGKMLPSSSDVIEVGLIFSLLGGVDADTNGKGQSIAVSDVEQLFHGTLPPGKTKFVVDAPLFAHIMGGKLFGDIISAKIHEACMKILPFCP